MLRQVKRLVLIGLLILELIAPRVRVDPLVLCLNELTIFNILCFAPNSRDAVYVA